MCRKCGRNKRRLEISRDSFTVEKVRWNEAGRPDCGKEVRVAIRVSCVTRANLSLREREKERERKRKRGVRGSRVPSLSPYQAETNLSWRNTLAVSIYSDTRRISRERPTRPTFPPHRLCVPAIHLRCMSPDSAHTGPCENSTLWNSLKPNRRMHFVLPAFFFSPSLFPSFQTFAKVHCTCLRARSPPPAAPPFLVPLTSRNSTWNNAAKWISVLFLLKPAASANAFNCLKLITTESKGTNCVGSDMDEKGK